MEYILCGGGGVMATDRRKERGKNIRNLSCETRFMSCLTYVLICFTKNFCKRVRVTWKGFGLCGQQTLV